MSSAAARPAVPRPDPGEYAPYYGGYLERVPDGVDLLDLLERQRDETLALLDELGEARGAHRYAPGKWSVKEVVGHVIDTERIFSYRLLRFARGDTTPLPGFEQDDYVAAANFDRRPLAALAEEFRQVRGATLALLRALTPDELARGGVASGYPMTARAMAYVIAGHERHHAALLRERYGG